MNAGESTPPLAILAGGGRLPQLVAAAAQRRGRLPVVFAIDGEADALSIAPATVHVLRWGQIGRLFRLLEEHSCREAVLVGSIRKRPDYRAMLPDLGTVKLLPRILKMLQRSDGSLLDGIAEIIEERGVRVVSPLAVAPELALAEGVITGEVTAASAADIEAARRGAREVGSQDIAQGAIATGGRLVGLEDAGGTDALLERIAMLRRDGAIPAGGVLVKLMKPRQDERLDLPAIGPQTAERAAEAGLAGVAGEAGRSILVGSDATVDAFHRAGLFLVGLKPAPRRAHG